MCMNTQQKKNDWIRRRRDAKLIIDDGDDEIRTIYTTNIISIT